MKNILLVLAILFLTDTAHAQTSYKFDTTASVIGCSNVFLQKRSKDLQYELMVEINQIDSLPMFKNFELSKYSKFVTLYLNQYPAGNQYIMGICDDLIYPNKSAKPDKYSAKHGTMLISKWDGKFTISVILTDIELENQFNKKLKLKSETFNHLTVGWSGG